MPVKQPTVPLHKASGLLASPVTAATYQTPALFKPIKVGRLTLQHRIVLAPLTRFRAYTFHVPGPQQASYYSQRGSTPGTLLITEGTFTSHDAGGYGNVPGIYTDEHIKGHRRRACQGIVHWHTYTIGYTCVNYSAPR
ncbi:hypothetical protein JVT61DRAFT_14036 [Boletus reticuloceps]|uniref:NADH:flavin oxidoreductase/NADH oxidase N-terminal domain-containing protein n=1 Tax=Boletus reticuloceps TaxID=495285 RepID=A0A8I2YUE3_9AGAM|nr:hypothetical protein JVT61DRAFT_14036 [Boletus reticuloceps]